jgi:uncharacterized membrane protein YccC
MADADDGMDRATIERNLAQVERDLRAASEDIAYQQETLRNLVRHGEDEDTTEAVRSIGILEYTHLVLSSLRDQLDEELATRPSTAAIGLPHFRYGQRHRNPSPSHVVCPVRRDRRPTIALAHVG